MVSLSSSTLPEVDIGTNVVRVPDFDRGRLAPRNVRSVVNVKYSGLYLLGSEEGLLERLYARTEFTTGDFIKAQDVHSSSLNLRSAPMIRSRSKQAIVSCHCRRYRIDKKCKWRSKNMKCNSKCHSISSCKNKWASPLFFTRPTLYVFLSISTKLLNN